MFCLSRVDNWIRRWRMRWHFWPWMMWAIRRKRNTSLNCSALTFKYFLCLKYHEHSLPYYSRLQRWSNSINLPLNILMFYEVFHQTHSNVAFLSKMKFFHLIFSAWNQLFNNPKVHYISSVEDEIIIGLLIWSRPNISGDLANIEIENIAFILSDRKSMNRRLIM